MNKQNKQSINPIDSDTLKRIFDYPPETRTDDSGFSEKDVLDFLRKVFEYSRVSYTQILPTPFVYTRRARKLNHSETPVPIVLAPEIQALINGNKEGDSCYVLPLLNITDEEKENMVKTRAKEKAAFEKMLVTIKNGRCESFREAIDRHLQNIAKRLELDIHLNFHSFQTAIEKWNMETTIAKMISHRIPTAGLSFH